MQVLQPQGEHLVSEPSPAAITLRIPLAHPERWATALALILAIAFNLIALYPEVSAHAPPLNDNVLHLLNIRRVAQAFAEGQNPTDPWVGQVTLGYPLFHYYQHLAYLLPGLLVALTKGALSAEGVLRWSAYLLLSLFPLSLYWSGRRWGLNRLPALLASVLGPLIATRGLYGFDASSYVWSGYGLYTQLWGMWLLPMALAQGYTVLRTGRGYLLAVFLVAATLLSHLVYGYILLVSLALLVVLAPWRKASDAAAETWLGKRAARLLALLALVVLVSAYFLAPYLADRALMNRSIWELPWKYMSFGAQWVLTALVKGELLDAGRFPSLTLLFAVGLGLCVWHWGQERYRALTALTLLWLLLYFGRPTWGVLLDLLPMGRDLHLHRLIGGFHLGAIYLMGLGLALLWDLARSQKDRRYLLAPAALTLLLLLPVYQERAAYYRQNGTWMTETATAVAAERESLDALAETLRGLPPGRVYAGLANRWGGEIKVGAAPLYTLLQNADLDMVGYLYHALSLNADIQVLFDDGRYEQYDLFNIRYVVLPQDWTAPAYYRVLGDYGRFRLYQVATSGYFDLVDSDVALVGSKEDFYHAASTWLGSDLLPAKQHPAIALGRAPAGYAQVQPLADADAVISGFSAPSAASRGAVLSETVEGQTYQAQVQVERDSFLMLKVGYHPRWRATVDGVAAETVMLMPAYIGVRLSPGQHTVRLVYRPGAGRAILLTVGLLTLLLLALAGRRPEATARLLARWRASRAARWLERAVVALQASVSQYAAALGLIAVVALSLLAGLPLLQPQMMTGHDAPEYITRAVEFFEVLRTHALLPQWAPNLNFGYGEPFFVFNPPLIYYLMSLFRALGTSYVVAQNLASLTILMTSGFGMYLLIASQFGRKAGVLAAAAYLFAPYMLVALYVRQALADFAAFAPLPFALWGLQQYATGHKHRYLVVGAASVAILMLSSNPVALLGVPALLLWATWHAIARRNVAVALKGLAAVALGLGLSAFFWIPALVDRHLVQTSRLLQGHLNYQHHFVYPSQFGASIWGYGLSVPGPGDTMPFTVGPVHLMVAGAAVLLLLTKPRASRETFVWLACSLTILLLSLFFSSTLSKSLWDLLALFQYLQFPWRFLSLTALMSAILCGAVFRAVSDLSRRMDARIPSFLGFSLLVMLLVWGVPRARPEGYFALDESWHSPSSIKARGIGVTTAGEYAPVWVQERPQAPAVAPLEFVSGNGWVLASRSTAHRQEHVVDVRADGVLQLNTFYFPGWKLYVDGAEHPLDYDNPKGVMRFSLGTGTHGILLVFGNTAVRTISRFLSAFALILLTLRRILPPPVERQVVSFMRRLTGRLRNYLLPARDIIRSILTRHVASYPEVRSLCLREKTGVCLLFLSLYLASAAGHFFVTDHVAVYLTAQSLVEQGNLAIKPIKDTVLGPDGRHYANYGIGQSLALVPFYLLGRAVERVASPEGARYFGGVDLGDWGGTVPIFFASLLNQLVTPLTCLLVLQFCLRLGYSRRASWAATLVFGFGTAAWPYARDSFQHPLESLLLLSCVYILYAHKDRLQPRHALFAGIALAGAALTRVNVLWVAPALAIYLFHLVSARRVNDAAALPLGEDAHRPWLSGVGRSARELGARVSSPRTLGSIVLFALPVALAVVAVLLLNRLKYGAYLAFNPLAQAQGFVTPLWMGLYGQLFSLGRSLFLYSPPILLILWAARPFYREHRAEALLFAAIIAIYLLAYSAYGGWVGGWSWGNRFLLATLPFLALPLAGFARSRARALTLAILACLGVGVQVLGVVVNYSYVHWEWLAMNLSPWNAYLFAPAISPLAMHWRALWAGRHIDLWLLYVLRAFGASAFLLTLLVELSLLGVALWLLGGFSRARLALRPLISRLLRKP